MLDLRLSLEDAPAEFIQLERHPDYLTAGGLHNKLLQFVIDKFSDDGFLLS